MVNARIHHRFAAPGGGRFNVLLTEDDRPRGDEHWIRQLPRLLEPQGVIAHIAHSGEEAINLAEHLEFHAAVIDLSTPRNPASGSAPGGVPGTASGSTPRSAPTPGPPGGLWLLELFRRLPNRPPTVVVTTRYYAARDIDRFLREALRLGAFSVLHQPIDLERVLAVFRSLVDRQYRGNWPSSGGTNASDDS